MIRVVVAVALAASSATLVPGAAGAGPEREPGAPVPVAGPPPGNAFPIPAPYEASFSDDWHACRDGCNRRHKGNDLFAEEGTPIVAVEPGVIDEVDDTDDSNGGLSIWLRGDSGVSYWYAHNSANLVTKGQRVARGQVIGRVGRTGNARTTPPHIHFQVNACGGRSSDEPCTVDPYEHLRRWPQLQIDGGADAVGVYRPSTATVELRIEGGSRLPATVLGSPARPGDVVPVAGDWDGDGRDTVGLYRRSDATFVLADGEGQLLPPVVFGARDRSAGAVPVAGDWDGDGRDTVGLYRRSDATFVLADAAGRALRPVVLGSPGATDALPVAGDWDGDGRDSIGLFTPGDATFVFQEGTAPVPRATFGAAGAGALPLVGDWDGDGRDTAGTFRPHDGSFALGGPDLAGPARGATAIAGPVGGPSADLLPIAGDWNGNDLVTADDLRAIFGPLADTGAVVRSLPMLNTAMREAAITTPARKAAFLATVRHESGFDAAGVQPGDDPFRGRGFIQLTGAGNYRSAGDDLGLDIGGDPDLAATPEVSARVAAWYWAMARDINHAADELDMAAVNIAVGFPPSEREDTERCGDFVRALRWFNGGDVPGGVNCERTVASQLLAWATVLEGSSAGPGAALSTPSSSSAGGRTGRDSKDAGSGSSGSSGSSASSADSPSGRPSPGSGPAGADGPPTTPRTPGNGPGPGTPPTGGGSTVPPRGGGSTTPPSTGTPPTSTPPPTDPAPPPTSPPTGPPSTDPAPPTSPFPTGPPPTSTPPPTSPPPTGPPPAGGPPSSAPPTSTPPPTSAPPPPTSPPSTGTPAPPPRPPSSGSGPLDRLLSPVTDLLGGLLGG